MSITTTAQISASKDMSIVMVNALPKKNVALYLEKEQVRPMWPVPTTTMKILFISQLQLTLLATIGVVLMINTTAMEHAIKSMFKEKPILLSEEKLSTEKTW